MGQASPSCRKYVALTWLQVNPLRLFQFTLVSDHRLLHRLDTGRERAHVEEFITEFLRVGHFCPLENPGGQFDRGAS